MYCKECGKEINDKAVICPECGCKTKDGLLGTSEGKSKVVALILWFFLGMLGAHRFYIGDTDGGAMILGLTIIGSILSLIFVGFILVIIAGIICISDLIVILSSDEFKGHPISWN